MKYQISPIRTLIDLNKDLTNFHLTFQVSSEKSKPFQILVIDQPTLDKTDKLEYETVTTGYLSGEVKADSNVYKSYYMLLRADEPTEVEVRVDITPLEAIKDSASLHTNNTNLYIGLLITVLVLVGVCILWSQRRGGEGKTVVPKINQSILAKLKSLN